jgi:hypothetical protein
VSDDEYEKINPFQPNADLDIEEKESTTLRSESHQAVHISTFEAQLKQAVESRRQAEAELATSKKEIAVMKEEVDTTRRKFELREKLLAEKELMNAEREALLTEQLEMLK